jgi:CcdB protein
MVKQYDVFRASGRFSSEDLAYLIVLQSGDFSHLNTALSAPIRKIDDAQVLRGLHIPVTVEGEAFHISMAELAAFPLKRLGQYVENQNMVHSDVMLAVDLLFAGF